MELNEHTTIYLESTLRAMIASGREKEVNKLLEKGILKNSEKFKTKYLVIEETQSKQK